MEGKLRNRRSAANSMPQHASLWLLSQASFEQDLGGDNKLHNGRFYEDLTTIVPEIHQPLSFPNSSTRLFGRGAVGRG
jgi:hypothetical protein